MMKTASPRGALLWLVIGLVMILVACMPTGGQAIGDLRIDDPWARATPPGVPVSGGYLVVRNFGRQDDRLISVSSAAIARIEIHEVRHVNGLMKMRLLNDGLGIPAGAAVALQPGGYHLMMIDLKQPFAAGDVVLATLHFEQAGDAEVAFQVRGAGAKGAPAHHH